MDTQVSLDDLWNTTNGLYTELDKKGMLIINGMEPNVEVGYLYGNEYVMLSEGTNLRNAVNSLYETLYQEAKEQINRIEAEADARIASLNYWLKTT